MVKTGECIGVDDALNASDDSITRSIFVGEVRSAPKIAWFFDDVEHNLSACAKSLFHNEPVFRTTVEALDNRLSEHIAATSADPMSRSLSESMQSASEDPAVVSAELQLFAFQSGLAKLWQSWGIEPDLVLGLGIGQITASCVGGGLCFMDAAALIFERQKVASFFEAASTSETADSSADAATALDQFEAFADTLNYYPPNLPLACSISGDIVPIHRSLGGSYWRRHCVEDPLSREALLKIADEVDCCLTIGSGTFATNSSNSRLTTASTVANLDAVTSMANALARLYARGARVDFAGVHKYWDRRKVSLPTYPFQKKRYWITEIDQHTTEQKPQTLAR